jgi:hypothetical protein
MALPKVKPCDAWHSEDGASSAKIPRFTGQLSQKISTSVDDRHNTDALSAESIDEAVISDDQLSDGFVLVFWNNATQLRVATEPFDS